ncbi:MAG: DUF2058 family protein [Planctomycetota bacterium]
MGDLFDELKKAKLIDEKRARNLAHEQRVERSKQGGDRARDAEERRKREEFEERRSRDAEADRERERTRREGQQHDERQAELRQQVRAKALGREGEGKLRWHFETADGELPFLPVSETVARRLEAGELAIVRDPAAAYPAYVVVPRDVALALRRELPANVCFLTGA